MKPFFKTNTDLFVTWANQNHPGRLKMLIQAIKGLNYSLFWKKGVNVRK
jgi:hypothetical protein